MRDLIGEAWEDIKPHVEDELRSNAMNPTYQQLLQAIQPLPLTKRVIFRCKSCKRVRTFDYAEYQGHLYRLQPWCDGILLAHPEYDLRCSCGSQNVNSGQVVGTVTHKHCNERCEEATNAVCNCSCGGARHGIAYKER